MAKQTSKTVIGVFVISAAAMLIVGVMILGGGEVLKEKQKAIMFFDRSVKGLSVGSPVVVRGVTIGKVSKIVVNYDRKTKEVDIPVIVEVDPSLINIIGQRAKTLEEQRQDFNQLIELGFRAQLTLQSLVTGQLMIELDFHPGTPVRLIGTDTEYPEIPTIQTGIDEFVSKLKKLPIDKIATKLYDVLDNIDKVVGGPEIKDILHNVDTASKDLTRLIQDSDNLVKDDDGRVNKLLDSLVVTSGDAQKFLGDARKLVKDTDSQVQPVSDKVQDAMVSAKGAMDQAKTTLAGMNNYVGEKSDTRHKLNRTLDEIGAAARSLNSLMDYLERHPEALVHGKKGGGG
jgi:paraquat-inducible protein B